MPVHSKHALYTMREPQWQRCRDALAGGDAIKAAGEAYLPRLTGQGLDVVDLPGYYTYQVDEYQRYKARALWYNATGRTVEGLVGALMRKAPVFDVPAVMRAHLDDLTLTRESAEQYAERLITELISVGRHGILVEWPRAPEETDEARRDGIDEARLLSPSEERPYWVHYATEDILNWPSATGRGLWVLAETRLVASDDEFVQELITQWRVLDLDADGWYRQRVYRKVPNVRDPQLVATSYPVNRGQRLDFVPFICAGTPNPEKPPILDVVDLNLSHYRTSADLEEARHKLAVPTPYAWGFPADMKLRLGANIAYVSESPQAGMGMLEFSGAGLGELRLALQEKEAMMAAIGARLLEAPKAGIESAEAIRLRTSGEMNVLMNLAQAASAALTTAMRYHAWWLRAEAEAVTVTVNTDFIDNRLTPQEAHQNLLEYQAHVISYETLYWRMQRGECTRPHVTADEELSLIQAEAPLAGEIDLPPARAEDEEAA